MSFKILFLICFLSVVIVCFKRETNELLSSKKYIVYLKKATSILNEVKSVSHALISNNYKNYTFENKKYSIIYEKYSIIYEYTLLNALCIEITSGKENNKNANNDHTQHFMISQFKEDH